VCFSHFFDDSVGFRCDRRQLFFKLDNPVPLLNRRLLALNFSFSSSKYIPRPPFSCFPSTSPLTISPPIAFSVFLNAFSYSEDDAGLVGACVPSSQGRRQNQRGRDPARASQEKRQLRFCRSRQKKRGLKVLLSAELRQGRSDQGSSPCSMPPRSPSQTPPSSRRMRRPPRLPGAESSNRRQGRHGCRST
jgi:hypothetical protein